MKRRINKLLTVLALLLLFAGMTVILIPHVCKYLYKVQGKRAISAYEERLKEYIEIREEPAASGAESEGREWDWLYGLIVEYNEKLYKNGQSELVDAFSYQQVDFSLVRFGFDEEMIGYLRIPKMDLELPVYLGANKENMMKGAALLTQTSLPVGGVNTNAVFAAHRGMTTAAMFRDIEDLEVGDEVFVTNFREQLAYRVAEIAVIAPTDIDAILIQEGQDLVTLITCHPYSHNFERYVVYCTRITETKREVNGSKEVNRKAVGIEFRSILRYDEMSESQQRIFLEHWIPVGVTVPVVMLVVILLIFIGKRENKTKS